MTEFTVGKIFPIRVDGMFMLRLMGSQGNVIFNFPNPTIKEQNLMQDGTLQAAIYQHSSGLAFFLAKFAQGDWMDTPIHYTQNDEESLADFYAACDEIDKESPMSMPMGFFMIDANTGILKQMRLISPPPSLWLNLRDVFQKQEKEKIPYSESHIQVIYGQLTSEEMADKAQERMVFCKE